MNLPGEQADNEPARILVVEDEMLIALDITSSLEDAGFVVAGPYASVAESLEDLAGSMPDGAVLDVQLDGEAVELVANSLYQNDVPIIFHSGHADPAELQERFPGSRFVRKPCMQNELVEHVTSAVKS